MSDCADAKSDPGLCCLHMGRVKWKSAFGVCADSEGPDQTAQLRSLIRAFTVCEQNCLTLQHVYMANKCQHETSCMCGWIWMWAFCVCLKTPLHLTWPIYYWAVWHRSLLFTYTTMCTVWSRAFCLYCKYYPHSLTLIFVVYKHYFHSRLQIFTVYTGYIIYLYRVV